MTKYKHRYQNKVFSSLNGRAVLVHPGLKQVLGTLNAAIWLSQILYWYDKGETAGEIKKSRSQIEKETGLTRDQQIRVEEKMKRAKVVTIRVKPGRPSPINHISINFDVLDELILELRGIRILKDEEEVSRYTPFAENISKNIHKNTYKKDESNNMGSGYKEYLEERKKLSNRMSIK